MLTIDLSAIQNNWLRLASMTSASVAGVIKANAYGLGAKEVGTALYAAGCKEFFLATYDEALDARSFLPSDAVIYMLGGLRCVDLAELHNERIIPVLCSGFDIEQWLKLKKINSSVCQPALKINTGMNRFGIDSLEFSNLCADIKQITALRPALIMSHLACADDERHDKNTEQLNKFLISVEQIRKKLPHIRASLANSSGIFLGNAWHFDLVRPGAALYGLNPAPLQQNPMSQVLKLLLPIRQIRTLSLSESVGYGATATLPVGAKLAVVSGGYADGLHRTLGAQPAGILYGHRVNVVGRISMDSMIFDISAVSASEEELMNSSIEVIGEQLPLDEHIQANQQNLGYEVLTSLGDRFKRSYIGGDL